jgi:cellobiose phosphorylase
MAFAELGDRRRAWEIFAMINPVNHAKSAGAVATYRVEPYVMAADVYAAPPHVGRGGWTWYTGSAGWMYRLAVESLLGLRREGDKLRLVPRPPAAWPGFKLRYRYGDTVYRISVVRDEGAGVEPSDHVISLVDDRREHLIELRIP